MVAFKDVDVEPGATATDAEFGALAVSIAGDVPLFWLE
tara:strand:- start:480 stop:593 length:114 start_codon:yes stop_codon:yes gene_type:complete